jgi:hypothetical protein
MPNWCSNKLLVTGKPEDVKQFVEQMISSSEEGDNTDINCLDFEAVAPMPRILKVRKSPAEDGAITWYDWSVENWGTKWNSNNSYCDYTEGGESVFYAFETAWGPAIEWQEKLIAYYPWLKFEFEWEEPNMNFCGQMNGAEGKVTQMLEGEISEARYEEMFSDE